MERLGLSPEAFQLIAALQDLSRVRDLKSVQTIVGESARALTGADGVSFVLREKDQCYYAYENAIEPLWQGRRFSLRECISGWVIRTRQSVVVPNIYADPRIPLDAYRPTFVRSLAMVPIRADAPIGAIGAYWAREHRASEHDVAVLEVLASASSTAIMNVELMQALAAARDEAEAANTAKDQFLAILGHELRNPLSPIVTTLQMLQLRGEGALAAERTLIERQVRHLVRLVEDLLDISRITRGMVELRKRPIELCEAVSQALESAEPLLRERRHRVHVAVAPSGLCVEADEARLVQIIGNLLSNAARYTDPGGQIEIRAFAEDGHVALCVQDSGRGICAELLPHVFDLFVQARQALDRSGGGLGLGLAIVKSLAELHCGTVQARSEGPGRGSSFTLRLPRLGFAGAGTAPRAVCADALRPRGPARRILVVDDNRDAAESLVALLQAVGHMAWAVFDGPAALQAIENDRPDLALLDIGLPDMNGYDVAVRVRERWGAAAPPLVAVTGYGQPCDRQRSREAGFGAHLVKPVELDELQSVLERLAFG